jgi:hypothetical protein
MLTHSPNFLATLRDTGRTASSVRASPVISLAHTSVVLGRMGHMDKVAGSDAVMHAIRKMSVTVAVNVALAKDRTGSSVDVNALAAEAENVAWIKEVTSTGGDIAYAVCDNNYSKWQVGRFQLVFRRTAVEDGFVYKVLPLPSSDGTWINRKKVPEGFEWISLADGDTIAFGAENGHAKLFNKDRAKREECFQSRAADQKERAAARLSTLNQELGPAYDMADVEAADRKLRSYHYSIQGAPVEVLLNSDVHVEYVFRLKVPDPVVKPVATKKGTKRAFDAIQAYEEKQVDKRQRVVPNAIINSVQCMACVTRMSGASTILYKPFVLSCGHMACHCCVMASRVCPECGVRGKKAKNALALENSLDAIVETHGTADEKELYFIKRLHHDEQIKTDDERKARSEIERKYINRMDIDATDASEQLMACIELNKKEVTNSSLHNVSNAAANLGAALVRCGKGATAQMATAMTIKNNYREQHNRHMETHALFRGAPPTNAFRQPWVSWPMFANK